MARMGHDSERAAIIYQHESRGADRVLTARSTPVSQPPKPARATTAVARQESNSSSLMARNGPGRSTRRQRDRRGSRMCPLTWDFLERVTGIEPALSAWELDRS